jgi:5-amino-6-(5-phosphoribosylamino)uracil reductase
MNRPQTTVVLAMSADGKIADYQRSPARFGSATDKAHLETQIAEADAVLFGAETLRAYGTTLRVSSPNLLQHRNDRGSPPQPIHIVCSKSAILNPDYAFFRQPVPRWLLTTAVGATQWQDAYQFDQILIASGSATDFDWVAILHQLWELGLSRIVVTGGGTLVASLLAANVIDELWLTVCPLILGGVDAPTPVEGSGWLAAIAPRLQLVSVQTHDHEVFLHYRLQQTEDCTTLSKGQ